MSWSSTSKAWTPLIFFVTSVMVVTVRCGTVRPPMKTVPFRMICTPGVMGTQGFTSDPPVPKCFASNTRGIFCGVGVADECDGSLDGVCFVVETFVDVALIPVAALLPVQLADRTHAAAPTTTNQVIARPPNIAMNGSRETWLGAEDPKMAERLEAMMRKPEGLPLP